MSLYVILLSTDPDHQLLRRLISNYADLKKGFTLEQIMNLTSLSFDEMKMLKNMFGGNYSVVLTPTINFEYQNGRWEVEEIDVEHGFHQFIMKVLNHALKKGKYPIGSPVSIKDIQLIRWLVRKQQEVYDKEVGDTDYDKNLYPMDQEMMEFISTRLEKALGGVSHFDYRFVRVFLEALYDYEEVLIRREFT